MFRKRESEEIKMTVCSDASHKGLQQKVDELLKRAGLKNRVGASHDQRNCVCVGVFLYSLAMLHEFCYRPLPLPRPLFANWPEQLISPLAHD